MSKPKSMPTTAENAKTKAQAKRKHTHIPKIKNITINISNRRKRRRRRRGTKQQHQEINEQIKMNEKANTQRRRRIKNTRSSHNTRLKFITSGLKINFANACVANKHGVHWVCVYVQACACVDRCKRRKKTKCGASCSSILFCAFTFCFVFELRLFFVFSSLLPCTFCAYKVFAFIHISSLQDDQNLSERAKEQWILQYSFFTANM